MALLMAARGGEPAPAQTAEPTPPAQTAEPAPTVSADDAVVQVSTIGFVDLDGAKISTVVVEYNVDLAGAQVTPEMFRVVSYGSDQGNENCALGSDPGKPLKAYVNDKPEASAGSRRARSALTPPRSPRLPSPC